MCNFDQPNVFLLNKSNIQLFPKKQKKPQASQKVMERCTLSLYIKLLYKQFSNIPSCLLNTIITTISHKALTDQNTNIHFQRAMQRLRLCLFFRKAWQALLLLWVVVLGFWGSGVNPAVKAIPDNPVQNHSLQRGSERPVDLLKAAKIRKAL